MGKLKFESYRLENGLRVILHQDKSTPMVTVNVLYDVGSRDENPQKTGFAHLFEHLMFSGTPKVPEYDVVAQNAGATNNAFTSSDLTNYYLSLPADNLDVGLFLESDRMRGLSFSDEALEVQRKVVIEEFKQRYLNKPYGDVWLNLLPLAYKKHPYLWPTIGKSFKPIEAATMADVRDFFGRYYHPGNAILSVSGHMDLKKAKQSIDRYFGSIIGKSSPKRNLPVEPLQNEKRSLHLERKVPQDLIYKVYPMPGRNNPNYYVADLTSDLFGRGFSSRMYKKLIQQEGLFTQASASVMGSIDPGLFILSGMLSPGKTFEEAETAFDGILNEVFCERIQPAELQKLKRKTESSLLFNQIKHQDIAFNLAYFELLGNADLINKQMDSYNKVSIKDMEQFIANTLSEEKASALYYQSKN